MDQPLACLALSYRCDLPPFKHRLLYPPCLALLSKPSTTPVHPRMALFFLVSPKCWGFLMIWIRRSHFFGLVRKWRVNKKTVCPVHWKSGLCEDHGGFLHWYKVIFLQRSRCPHPCFSVTQRHLPRWLTPRWVSKPSAVLEYGHIITPALLIRIWRCFSSTTQPRRPSSQRRVC